MKRTHLPLNGLRVLDAAARHLSFTRAADELAVTPAAVGQQIRALEDTLGVVLFRRTARGLELTPEGEAGLGALRGGFLHFEDAVRAMQAGQSSKALTIAAPRDLTAKWLLPRLARIAAADGEMRFAVTSDESVDFAEANLDLAIRWGEGPGGLEGEALESDGFVTVGHPSIGADLAIGWPGCPGEDATTPVRVADAGLAIDAAAEGLGRANVPELLASRDVAAGRVAVVGAARPSRLGYWLVAPLPQWRQKKVLALVDGADRVSDGATLVTARLTLRPRVEADAEALHPALADPELMRWWSRAPLESLDATRDYLSLPHGPEWRWWIITRTGDPRAVGWVSAGEKRQGGVVEIGYLLARDAWGQGIAREAASAVIDRLFAEGNRRVFADTDPENAASNRLLEMLGFRREGLLRGEWETHLGVRDSVIWGLLRDEWRPGRNE